MNVTVVRVYEEIPDSMDSSHSLSLTSRLNSGAYDVYGWYGSGKVDTIINVPHGRVIGAIKMLNCRHNDLGIVGVRKLGINQLDSDMIALCGVGIH